ncbi:MAG: cupin domain-containing protein, partial [Pseudomonadota bacterium]
MFDLTLESLIKPHGLDHFFETYFEQAPLLIQRLDRQYYSGVLSVDDFDRLLGRRDFTPKDARVANALNPVETSDYVGPDGFVDTDCLLRLYEDGSTIILNHVHRYHQPVAELCASLGLTFGAPFQTNAYLTPASAQGFRPHFDTHDVFALQIEGSKTWKLYDTAVELAVKGHKAQTRQDDPGEPSQVIDLQAGDTL